MRFVWPALWFLLGGLVVYAWVAMRLKIRKALEVPPPHIDDQDVLRIEEVGTLVTDDPAPLDLEEIREKEDEFWEQTWDEAEEL
jgi:hypothetical protein